MNNTDFTYTNYVYNRHFKVPYSRPRSWTHLFPISSRAIDKFNSMAENNKGNVWETNEFNGILKELSLEGFVCEFVPEENL